LSKLSKNILSVIQERQSTRVPFDPNRKVSKEDLDEIIEAARWSPTPHNMQNFEIIVVDDPVLLKKISDIKSRISEDFLRENYDQLSFSRKELSRKKVGILGMNFPPAWRDPDKIHLVATSTPSNPLGSTMQGAPLVLIVLYDPRKRAPASAGDFLGIIGLGCVMENMWIVAQSLGISYQVMSVFGGSGVGRRLRESLGIPKQLKIAYAVRLGYVMRNQQKDYLRVRRDQETIVHYNRY